MEADRENLEVAGTWKNGPGVRYASSSRSSQRFDSRLCTPVSRTGEEEADTLQQKHNVTVPSLSQDTPQAQNKTKAKKKRRQKTFSFDDDRELEKKRQKETEKFLQIYQDLHKIRDHFYDEYMMALRKKITQQQKDIKERDAARERLRQAKLQQEKLLTHQMHKKLERHEFTHDDSFLKKIPKTQLFKIVQLEDKLRKKGTLKYNCEVDEFWTAIRKNPTVFNCYLEKLNTDGGSQSLFRKRLNSAQKEALDKLGEEWRSQPSESVTPRSTPGRKDSWAITQMYPHQQKRPSTRSSRRSSNASPSKQAASDLEKRCPKMVMPDLYCFKMDLSRKLPDPLEMLQSAKVQAKDHERKKYLRALHKMHQLAVTHQAASDRILQSHKGDLDMMYGGPDINDVIDVNFAVGQPVIVPDDTQSEGVFTSEEVTGSLAQPSVTSSHPLMDNSEEQEKDVVVAEDSNYLAALPAPPKPTPLTLEEVKDSCKVVEAQCNSVYWNNYLRAGKPVSI
ncbi:uncharacterized protein LOC135479764 [Liolophura sinensis]|uniref:uncharacterized protein LOC135479764 n=1 Tax=Liolophura sinensis TaxID=3198878 RepID=UPI00315939B8